MCSEVMSRTRGIVEARTSHEREVRCSNPGVSKVLQAIAAVDVMWGGYVLGGVAEGGHGDMLQDERQHMWQQ
jgi:hypothetical protein